MQRFTKVALAGLLVGGALQAQAPTPTMSGALQRSFASVSGFLLRAAEAMPEDKYAYRATAETRTFAEEIGHVADSRYFFCARARNEAMPQRGTLEKVTSKAQLVAGLKESIDYCTAAYAAATDANLGEVLQAGQARFVRMAPLSNNVAHDNEHYGKIVTLMRLNGMVPPSSQPR